MIYVRGGRAVRVRQGRRCAPIMINAPPSSLRQPSRTTLLPPTPPLAFPLYHDYTLSIPATEASRPLILHPSATVFSLFPPYPSFSLSLSLTVHFGLAGHSGHDRSAAPQLCSCRTGRSLLSWTSALCLCQSCHRFPPWRWSEGKVDRERDGQRKTASDEGK